MNDLLLLLSSLRYEGLGKTARRLAWRFMSINSFSILALNLEEDLPSPAPLPPGAEFKELEKGELARLRGEGGGLPVEFYRDRIAPGERCIGLIMEGRLALVCWLSTKGSSGLISLSPGEVELNHIHCLPRYRGHGLLKKTATRFAALLRPEGCRRVLSAVHTGNPPSLRSLTGAGFRSIGTVKRWAFITWRPSGPSKD